MASYGAIWQKESWMLMVSYGAEMINPSWAGKFAPILPVSLAIISAVGKRECVALQVENMRNSSHLGSVWGSLTTG